jgi:hypothetical protein
LRAEALAHDRVDVALLCMSSPLGVEALPAEEARPLLDAGTTACGPDGRFRHWGAIALDGAVPADVDAVLDRGALGLSLPAGALSGPERLGRIGPLLEALERRHAPLLVHPGPGLEDRLAGVAPVLGAAALVARPGRVPGPTAGGLAGLRGRGPARASRSARRVRRPGGCAPLHAERIAARGGPVRRSAIPSPFTTRRLTAPAR